MPKVTDKAKVLAKTSFLHQYTVVSVVDVLSLSLLNVKNPILIFRESIMSDALFNRSACLRAPVRSVFFTMVLASVLVMSSSFAAEPSRVTLDLVAEYNFLEGSGSTVNDVSEVTPALNLTIDNAENTQWLECGGLSVNSTALISSGVPATKIIDGVKASEALTVEAWITPASTSQSGPARIVTLSDGGYKRNVTLGQNKGVYQTRLRTTTAGDNGTSPYVETSSNVAMSLIDPTHVVFTRDASGNAITYINGVASVTKTVDGSVSSWDDTMQFALANEIGTDRNWLGKLFHVAVYDRALSTAEVIQNLNMGVVGTCGQAPSADFSFEKVTNGVEYTVDFDAGASYDVDGSIVNYAWDFGDGSSATGVNISHTFANAGQYTVTLVTTDDQGATDQMSQMVVVLASGRVVQNQVLFYNFSEGAGTTVNDLSGVGTPINLTIPDASKVSWLSCGGLSIDQATFVSAASSPLKMIDAVQASNELTIEAWVTPDNTTQSGPARIVTYSIDGSNRNFTLGQNKTNYDVRLRTTSTSNNGLSPSLSGTGNDATTTLTHVVYTRDNLGQAKLYKNGTLVKTATIGSSMENWNNSYVFGLANENGTDRNWLGDIHLVAVYSRALIQQEVDQNFSQGGGDTCSNFNAAPVLTAIADQTVLENTNAIISLDASDADNDALTFSVTGLPSFVTLSGSEITVTPNYDAAGAYGPITVSVTDGIDTDSTTFALTITNNNQSPEITSIPVTIIAEGQSYQYNVVAMDNDGDVLTYSLGVAPTGMSVNPLSGVVAWEPNFTSSGAELVIVNVTDGQQSVQQSYTITINNTNQAPVINSAPITSATENMVYQYTVVASDADGDALDYQLTAPLPGMLINTSGEISWIPTFTQSGDHTATVTASDGVLTATQSFVITVVNTNQPPVLTAITNQTVVENNTITVSLSATDADNDTLIYSVVGLPSFASLNGAEITITPGYDDAGSYGPITVTATDGVDSGTSTFTINVTNNNQAPTITSLPITTIAEGQEYQYSVIATDADGGSLTYSLSVLPAGMNISLLSGVITWTPTFNDAGAELVVVEVSDGEQSVQQSFTLTVKNTNQAPVISSTPITNASENTDYQYNVLANDPDGDALTYQLVGAPEGMSVNGGGVVSWIPSFVQSGDHAITIIVADGDLTETQSYMIAVANTNDAPKLSAIANQSVSENQTIVLTLQATDVDSDLLTYSVVGLPSFASHNNTEIIIAPNQGDEGSYGPISVSVSDGVDNHSVSFLVVVTSDNQPPEITSTPEVFVLEGDLWSYTLEASDPDDDNLMYSVVQPEALPNAMAINSLTGEVSWLTADVVPGNYEFTFVVQDDNGLTDEQSLLLEVLSTKRAATHEGTDFWLAAAKNFKLTDTVYHIYMVSQQPNVNVTIEIPILGKTESIALTQGVISTYSIPVEEFVNVSGLDTNRVLENHAIHITSTDNMSVYMLNQRKYSTDGLLGLPASSLGKQYIVGHYTTLLDAVRSPVVGIIATKDDTQVKIKASMDMFFGENVVDHEHDAVKAGDIYTLNLNAGDVYNLSARGSKVADFTGTLIDSDKPIVVLGEHDCAYVPKTHAACDHLIEQLPPIESLGVDYITAPLFGSVPDYTGSCNYGYDNCGDVFRIVAPFDDTQVYVNGVLVRQLDSQEFYEFASIKPQSIHASQPIMVLQFSSSLNRKSFKVDNTNIPRDPFMVVVPPSEQYLTKYTVNTPSYDITHNFLNVMIPTSAIDSAFLDGVAVDPAKFNVINGSAYSYAQLKVTTGSHQIESADPFGLIVYGYDSYDSYGYLGGMAFSLPAEVASLLVDVEPNQKLGESICVSASVKKTDFKPAHGVRVKFVVEGTQTTIGYAMSNQYGEAEYCYSSHQVGIDDVAVQVGNLEKTVSISWLLADSNQAPVITSLPNLSVVMEQSYNYQVEAIDPNGDLLTYSLEQAPSGMTISDTGLLEWVNVSAVEKVYQQVAVQVTDLNGAVVKQRFQLHKYKAFNTATVFKEAVHATTATVGVPYVYNTNYLDFHQDEYKYEIDVSDVDGDGPDFSLVNAPEGASIDMLSTWDYWPSCPSCRRFLHWTPTEIGDYQFELKLRDARGAETTEIRYFDVEVLPNTAPKIDSTPPTSAFVGLEYNYLIDISNDIPLGLYDNRDNLKIVLEEGPPQMSVGLVKVGANQRKYYLRWIPGDAQVDDHTIRIRLSDSVNNVDIQEFVVSVSDSNQVPVITSSPVKSAEVSRPYKYQIVAHDPDGDMLSYSLVVGVPGLEINELGLLTWEPTEQDLTDTGANYNYIIWVGVTDEKGAVTLQKFYINVKPFYNHAPEFVPAYRPKFAKLGVGFTHEVLATDREGDTPINYKISSFASGVEIDGNGVITWIPTKLGKVWMSAQAIDSLGNYASSNSEFWYLEVVPDSALLDAEIQISPTNIIDFGESVTVSVITENEASTPQVEITVDGEPVTVDAMLEIQVTPTHVGVIPVVATITDGLQTIIRETSIFVRDPADITPPVVEFNSPVNLADITAPTEIFVTAQDDNLVEVTLHYKRADKPLGDIVQIEDFVELYRGPKSFVNEAIASFDTTNLLNGTYQLLLQATDSSGLTAGVHRSVVVSGDLKVGNFSFTVVDANIPMAGFPISVSRTYDSRRRDESMDFGYGWSIDYQNLRLEENLEPTVGFYLEEQTFTMAFKSPSGFFTARAHCTYPLYKKVVTITLPNGEVETFIPKPRPSNDSLEAVGNPHCNLYTSRYMTLEFLPKGDTQSTLEAIGLGQLFLSDLDNGNLEYIDDPGVVVKVQNYKLTTKAGYVYIIDQDFGIKTITGPNGHVLTYTDSGISHSSGKSLDFIRDGDGRISDVKRSSGDLVMHYEYDANGDLEFNKDRLNAKTSYTYNGNHGLIDIVDPLNRKVMKNIYDDDGRLVGQENGDGITKSFNHNITDRTSIITDLDGRETHFNYDDRGNVKEEIKIVAGGDIVTSYTYDENDNQETKAIGGTLYTWVSEFDEDNNQLFAEDPEHNRVRYEGYNARGQEGKIFDELDRETVMEYNDRGSLEHITMPALTDPDSGEVTMLTASNVINGNGLVDSTTDLRGMVTTYTYYPSTHDWEFQKWTESNDISGTVTYTYDDNNNVKTEARERTVNNVVITETVGYDYDDRDRLTKTTYPDATYTETKYDLAGNIDQERDRFGVWTDYDYDVYGRLKLTTYVDGTTEIRGYSNEGLLESVIDRIGHETQYEYDDAARLWKTTFHNGSYTETKYTPQGWVQFEWDEKRNLTEYEYFLNGRRKAVIRYVGADEIRHGYTYYENGELHTETDPLLRVTTYNINEFDQRITTEFHNGTAAGQRYDAMGARTKQIDQNSRTTRYGYDDLGRLETVTPEVLINGQPVPDTFYTYDEVGNKLTQTDAEGRVTSWTYDYFGRVLTRELPEGMTETFTYDDSARTVAHTDFNGKTNTTYIDNQGRVDHIDYHDGNSEAYTYWDNGQVHTVTDQHGVTETAFDVRDRLDYEIKPDGTRLDYEYDDVGNREQVKVTRGTIITVTDYTFDALNRLDTVTDASGVTSYTYYDNGSLWTVTFPNGVVSEYQYNDVNQLEVLTTKDKDGVVLSSYTYGLDDTGRRDDITEADGRFTDYTYDNLYRLTDEVVTEGGSEVYNANYIYDWVGNRKYETVDGVQTEYAYDLNDRLTSQGGTVYTHDDNGNTKTETLDAVVTTYFYDAKNKMTSVDKGGVVTGYAYDSNGIRTSKTEGGVKTQFVVDLNRDYAQVLEEVVGDIETAPASVVYTYGHDLLNQGRGGDFRFYSYDGLGSTRALTDATGAITDTYSYEAFGDVLEETGTTENSYKFTGEQFDKSLDQYYLRARYYDQGIGRF
ncbi:hypothetical protein A9Q81_23950, partial [Gammaproteobacteria bacterium 42_54_T18]